MKITEINFVPIKANNGLIGIINLVYNNDLFLGSIGLYSKLGGGYRLTYPTKKSGTRDMNIYHPINKKLSREIEDAIFDKLKEVLKDGYYENKNNSY